MKKSKICAIALLIGIFAAGWLTPQVLATSVEETEATEATQATDATEAIGEAASVVEIFTPEDLQAMAKNPEGSYILMQDVDMSGIDWKPVDFRGAFDGNGHAILNLTLSEPGEESSDTYDGNLKVYESCFVGLFGTLRHAEVKDLELINVRALVDTDESCFLGGIAGYAEKSTISDCTVTGNLELRAHNKMFGVGGLVGYGSGLVERCDVDVTLICTDTDQLTRDEQFLGGILGMGFMDVKECEVAIDGYTSDYGYVHTGGMIGMLLRYPLGDWTCQISDNSITGKITFFEYNWDRRAYCDAFVGEFMTSYRTLSNNTEAFEVDERFEYDKELRPEMCEEPVYKETVVAGDCNNYGYTSYECESCGYIYTDHYTMQEHVIVNWTVEKEPTTEEEGWSIGSCECGAVKEERVEEKLEPEPTEAPTEPPTEAPETVPVETEPVVEESESGRSYTGYIIVGVIIIVVALGMIGVLIYRRNQAGRFLREDKKSGRYSDR